MSAPYHYDALGTPAELPALNVGSSNGWTSGRYYAGGANGTASPHGMVDLIVHQGKIHAAWVEPIDDSGTKRAYGPYVKRLDGGSWTALGGEVNPTKFHEDIDAAWVGWNLFQDTSNGEPGKAVGTEWYPSRPRLASDGTDLYVGYMEHVCEYAPNPPPVGSYTLDCHGSGDAIPSTVSTNHQIWAPMRLRIFRWNGASWDLFGEMPAETYNTLIVSGGAHGDSGNVVGRIGLCASPSEPGVVYASFAEKGYESSVPAYIDTPVFFVGFVFGGITPSPWKASLRWGRFTGGGSTIKVVAEDIITDFCHAGDTAADTRTQAGMFSYTEPINEDGAYLVWRGTTYPDPITMTRWSDLAVVQTTDTPHSGTDNTAPSHNGSRVFFQSGINPNAPTDNPIMAVPLDGSSTFVEEADVASQHLTPNYFEALSADGVADVWGVGRYTTTGIFGISPQGTLFSIYGYSYTCPIWRNLKASYLAAGSVRGTRFLKVNIARLGDTLYVAASHYKAADASIDLQPRVYEIPILRDDGTCFEILPLHLET